MATPKGFTLVELLLAVSLIGLIAVVATPRVSRTDKVQRALAEGFLLEAFRTARQEAVRNSTTCGVSIDSTNRRLRFYRYGTSGAMSSRKIHADAAGTNMTCLLHPVTRIPFDENYGADSEYPELALTFNGFRGVSGSGTIRTGDIQFDPAGRPWVFDATNAPVPLTKPQDTTDPLPLTSFPVVITVGAQSSALIACPLTGRIFVATTAGNPCAN